MPTAIATSRGWNARSSVSSESFAASPTDILEPAARMKEPSECPTPTQKLAPRPSRSQYVRNGTSNFSRASFPPGVTSSTDEVRGSSKSLGFPAQPERCVPLSISLCLPIPHECSFFCFLNRR